MSRCFPYPPPGYARKVARTEAALIEPIKLLSERREKGTERKKEKSKHKKEKSKDKKHKSKEHRDKSSRSSRRYSNDQKQKEVKDLLKGTKVEAEQLEKSGLTEEHGQPVWPQSPGYLSDGTQSNHKRKRGASIQPNEDCKPGKVIRIKLASSLSQQEDSSAGSEQTCSTTGRRCNPLHQTRDENSSRVPIVQKTSLTSLDQKRDENSGRGLIVQKTSLTMPDTPVAVKDPISKPNIKDLPLHAVDIGTHRKRKPSDSAYEDLFDKWVPPTLQLGQQTDNEEWLFGPKKQDERTKTNQAFSHAPICRSSSLWPRGQFVPEADVYMLPYTIPF
ncbi:uncharacterized protein LOC111454195 isoform X2 [Cucurbita moschata]|uniref:Uncharacterized protein LOC111454195 isoform X2 n=1 Tax=Cucurbita moschata TaxID=3662 RepID=A0A6J1GHB8_CUCMO|nr:uncharacterized protein LOC111454195 isoform X2 [Cucurbita moschata]